MIHLGSQSANEPIQVVFSCCEGAYAIHETFPDLLELGISVRETKWKKISQRELQFISHFRPVADGVPSEEYLLPTDGISNYSDCDFWMIISDRLSPLLAPVIPYGLIVYDYIQRYVPGLIAAGSDQSFLATARNAKFVITSTPQTFGDAIQYAGIDPKKVLFVPMEFRPPCAPFLSHASLGKPYFLWVTNASKHKNHERALKALEQYYQEGGELDLLITGTNSHLFNDENSENLYVQGIAKLMKKSPFFQKKCHLLGEVSDAEYTQYLSNAQFLWHPTIIDNGTFCVVEAAYLKVPSLASDYPAMRYMNERFKLNLQFSNPYQISDMAKKLKGMEKEAILRRDMLPEKGYLDQFTVDRLASHFWNTLKAWL